MNKIERAISDCQLKIEEFNREIEIMKSKKELPIDMLINLESINESKDIPNETPLAPHTN